MLAILIFLTPLGNAMQSSLGPAASEQVLKLLSLARQGEEVFGSTPAFRRWLDKPAEEKESITKQEE